MKNQFRFMPKTVIITVLILAISSGSARGAGFAVVEQGVRGLGNAYAGGAASAEDATTIFFNPAGLTRLSGQQVIANAHLIMPSADFNNEGSTHMLQAKTGVPLLGGNGGDGGEARVVPNLYYSNKFTDRLAAGIGINALFSLASNYDETWVGRYHAIESDLITVNVNPSLAYRMTDRFSMGVGFNAQYIKAKLSNAIDFGTLDAVGAFKALGLAPAALKLIPQQSDGFVKLEGDHWAFGYNAGLLHEFTQDTRIGAAYRSRMKYTIKGDAEFSNVPPGLSPYPDDCQNFFCSFLAAHAAGNGQVNNVKVNRGV